MSTFKIAAGTPGFLITQNPGVDVEKTEWVVRYDLSFQKEEVMVSPEDYENYSSIYPKNSLAQKLAADGYYVFSEHGTRDASYMIAINRHDVYIT